MAFGSQQWMYASGGFYPHEIDNSARLDTNSYFQRTPSSSGSRTTWTWNAWVKLGSIGQTEVLFTARNAGQSASGQVYFEAGKLAWDEYDGSSNTLRRHTTQVFRDPSAWYMITIVADTTNATASNRGRVYINGTQVTEFSTNVNPSQNQVLETNQNITHRLGANTNNVQYFNGYMAEVNFIDGQALDPTDFGETKSGVWIPKEYSGTYGTNGFHLDFATRATDPIDASGNGNNWGSVNVVSTDWMLDSPTNNWATLNPLGPMRHGANYGTGTQTQGNLTVASTSQSYFDDTASTLYVADQKKWYYELRMDQLDMGAGTGYVQFNIGGAYLRMWYGASSNTQIVTGSTYNYAAMSNGDILMFAIDEDNAKGWFGLNGTWYTTSGTPDPAAGTGESTTSGTGMTGRVQIRNGTGAQIVTANFGQDSSFAGQATAQGNTDANGIGDFYYAPPAGFLALCTSNMPDPVAAINPALDASPQDHFNTVLYTGNGTGQSITGVGFQPDWVWIKSRSDVDNHVLQDSVRGVTKQLFSNTTDAETSFTNGVTSFDADGFTVATSNWSNENGQTRVGWNWKAGGAGVSNTDGTITSTVSANTDAGFSIVTFTAVNGSSYFGHGLDKEPEILIHKGRSFSNGWYTFTKFIDGSVDYARLDTTTAFASSGTMAFNSTTFKDWYSSGDFVAYCFHSVEGFSKFGTYTGNGSTDGPFVYTGFRPACVILKRTDSTSDWLILDNKRGSYNVVVPALLPNLSDAELTSRTYADFLSNGFKFRDATTGLNVSSGSYIYMAFAEMPFKYANAR